MGKPRGLKPHFSLSLPSFVLSIDSNARKALFCPPSLGFPSVFLLLNPGPVMNGFEFNKAFAAILVAVLVAMLAGFFAEKAVKPHMLDKNVYVVEGVAAASSAAPEAGNSKGRHAIAPAACKASAEAGQKTGRVCGTCHSFGKGEAAKIGPIFTHYRIKACAYAGFDYSVAMKAMPGDWTYEELNEFLYNPRGMFLAPR